MGTEKRERQKAAKAARLESERKAAARQKRIRSVRNWLLLAIGIVVLLLVLGTMTGCSSEDATATTADGLSYGSGACPPAEGADRTIQFDDAPMRCIDTDKTYTAEVRTTLGNVTLRLDTERTPLTTNNFVVLARYGYFDGTDLFRTEADSGIIQGGAAATQSNRDPGPGYTIPDEGGPFTARDYSTGAIAMARTGAPDSASSQFFLLASDGARYLADPVQAGPGAGTYVAFGTTTEGADVLQRLSALDSGDGAGTPTKTPKIERITITES